MEEQLVDITTPDGISDGYLYCAEAGEARPGVICLPDIVGIRDSLRQQARAIAERGYTVLMPNPFYRTSRTPLFSFKPVFGEEPTMQRLGELATPLTPEAIERDADAYVDFLSSRPATRAGALGVVGYCFTGAFALRIAAARPDAIALAASFHGGRLYTDAPTSPHRLLPRIKARLYFGHAVEDRTMPAEAIAQLDRALAAWGGRHESVMYEGARHGWTHSDSAVYHPEQAENALDALCERLSAELGQ